MSQAGVRPKDIPRVLDLFSVKPSKSLVHPYISFGSTPISLCVLRYLRVDALESA